MTKEVENFVSNMIGVTSLVTIESDEMLKLLSDNDSIFVDYGSSGLRRIDYETDKDLIGTTIRVHSIDLKRYREFSAEFRKRKGIVG